MILLDGLYINDSGGKVLLDYLINKLEATDKEITYLLDARVKGNVAKIKNENRVIFMNASILKRRIFYTKNKTSFSTVLCFGNLPPNIKIDAKVYTYFHQLLFLKLPEEMPFIKKRIYWLKTRVLDCFKKNTDFWLVQTSVVKDGLSRKYKISQEKIVELPFYEPLKKKTYCEKKPHSYMYVSNGTPHKNHYRLIEAFSKFYDLYGKGNLTLTVSNEFPEIVKLIDDKVKQGYPITNIGFVTRDQLSQLYSEVFFFIFPSLTESFGLGLIEAIESECKVIGAELPYTFAICKPSLTFDPLDVDSIFEALSLSLHPKIQNSYSLIHNQIDKLISILK